MKYESDLQKVITNLINDIKVDLSPTELSRVAAEQLLGDIVRRIHNQGENADGSPIAAQYSTKPMYISIEGLIRQTNGKGKSMSPRGKNGDKPFKNGKARKSVYFDTGYEGFKSEQTGNTKVNLTLTGQLQNDLLISPIKKDFGLSFSDYGLDLYPQLESHFGAVIWFPTKGEKNRMIEAINWYIDNKLKL